ncbi:hypothetical protein FB451DRAFT_441263 [Mycena latifolia]|nr:hypothetical protein FB451DRAFT_441263 [Mycena latifolia]
MAAESSSIPRKRARSDSSPISQPIVQDAQFYIESGDCIIRVEDTLFKIHRFVFVRDSPVFAGLFALPQGGLEVEGLQDTLPICLGGDSAADFRSFLKYVYAPALETQANLIPVAELQSVVAVACLAHKYEMASWQEWAFLVIDKFLTQDSGALSTPDYLAVYNVCHILGADVVCKRTTSLWLKSIRLTDLAIGDALDAAETHNDRRFLAALYELQLSRLPTTPNTMLFQPAALPMPGIAPVHVQRILAGYWSLSLSWSRLRQTLFVVPSRFQCPPERHMVKCVPEFRSQWDSGITLAEERHSIDDIRGRIREMRQHLQTHAVRAADRNMCMPSVDPLTTIFGNLPATLEGHFFVCEPAQTLPT